MNTCTVKWMCTYKTTFTWFTHMHKKHTHTHICRHTFINKKHTHTNTL